MHVELAPSIPAAPPEATLERWAWDYLTHRELSPKFELAPPPRTYEPSAPSRRYTRPGRGGELVMATKRRKTPGPEALRSPGRRAELFHTFLHHELQAAELMCWAILAFPDAPVAFRRGLAKIARDEVRHMQMYRAYLADLGTQFGDHPVRDWFWERVPDASSAAHFVATMGMGFEGGNLDHALRFVGLLHAVGDDRGAALQETIYEEEIPHVRFAIQWFQRFTGAFEFSSWVRHLPPPLSPMVMKGNPIERAGRARAGFSDPFLTELAAWQCKESGY